MATIPKTKKATAPQGEIASLRLDIHRTFFGEMLEPSDETLLTRGRGKGLHIYEQLKRDAHAGAVLDKRKRAVTSRPWSVEPASKSATDKANAEMVKAAFDHLRFGQVCRSLLEAVLKGFAVSEVMWESRDGLVLPAAVHGRDPRRFKFTVDAELRLLTRESMVTGVALPERKFIVHRYGSSVGDPYGQGVGHALFWPVFFKRQDISYWLGFCDRFGMPTVVGKYPNATAQKDIDKLVAGLRAIGQEFGIAVPEGMLVELLETNKGGSTDNYEKLARYMDEQISEAVLGETMSTTAHAAGMGSGQADVHNDVRLEVAQDDGTDLAETIQDTLVRWIMEVNAPGADLPTFEIDFEIPEDLEARARRDKTITEMGWEPTDDYIRETYGEGWVKKAPPEPMPGLPGAPGAQGQANPPAPAQNAPQGPAKPGRGAPEDPQDVQYAEPDPLTAQRAERRAQQASLDQAAEEIATDYQRLLGKRVESLVAMLESTDDLVTFREQLANLVDADPPPELVEAIARANFAAHALGRSPRKEGA